MSGEAASVSLKKKKIKPLMNPANVFAFNVLENPNDSDSQTAFWSFDFPPACLQTAKCSWVTVSK